MSSQIFSERKENLMSKIKKNVVINLALIVLLPVLSYLLGGLAFIQENKDYLLSFVTVMAFITIMPFIRKGEKNE